MKILATHPCPACDGQGQQLHPSWDEYHAQRQMLTPREFFLNLGYLPNEALPPLLIPCRTCRGAGEVEAWATVDTLFPRFLELYRRLKEGAAA